VLGSSRLVVEGSDMGLPANTVHVVNRNSDLRLKQGLKAEGRLTMRLLLHS
jgi:hypothetical protein